MRLLLVGAFPYPHYQGSQVYFQEQANALRAAGAEVSLLTYASASSGISSAPGGRATRGRSANEYWRALDGFEHRTSPEWTAPTSLRAGPSWAKPLGDLGLAITLRDAVASHQDHDAYDAILTHNAEAALVALHSLSKGRPPLVYCVHTLLGKELSAYLKGLKKKGFLGSRVNLGGSASLSRGLDRAGGAIDRWISKRVDGWIALTQSSHRVMRQFSSVPGALVPPALPEPESGVDVMSPIEVARQHSLEPDRFFLYSGNLDAYQELDILAAAAVELARRGPSPPVIVIATHGPAPAWAESTPGIEFRDIGSAAEMQALLSVARASLVMRRAEGGFPIKLVNSLALGTPVVAFHEKEWGLGHERDSLICAPAQTPAIGLADALDRLANEDGLAKKLAAGARALYLERHRPERAAEKTLALLDRIEAFQPR
jgi:glycosyltransferase involved in cell wall biosynthesis